MWFNIPVDVLLEVEAENEEDARLKAETICQKRIMECEFGHRENDRARVARYYVSKRDRWESEEDNAANED